MVPETLDAAKILKQFEDDTNFDFWSEVRGINLPVDVMVSPIAQEDFEEFLNIENIDYSVLVEDVEE